jgi:hypothetical protein
LDCVLGLGCAVAVVVVVDGIARGMMRLIFGRDSVNFGMRGDDKRSDKVSDKVFHVILYLRLVSVTVLLT